MPLLRMTAAALLLVAAGTTHAATDTPATPLADCVDLSPNHQGFGVGTQRLLIEDGDAHYRVSFYGDCAAIDNPQVEISTAGTANRLCPKATRVSSRVDTCAVRSVEQIDADRYARYRKTTR
jgi:hypothetical protein